jgi:hypothetical protein
MKSINLHLKHAFLFTSILLFSLCSCEKIDTKLSNDGDAKVIHELQKENDSLKMALQKAQLENNYWFEDEIDGTMFENSNTQDFKKTIENSLREKVTLIPIKATLGGKMEFENIEILSYKWLIADYSDGHVYGKSLFSYQLVNGKNFEFQLIDSVE